MSPGRWPLDGRADAPQDPAPLARHQNDLVYELGAQKPGLAPENIPAKPPPLAKPGPVPKSTCDLAS